MQEWRMHASRQQHPSQGCEVAQDAHKHTEVVAAVSSSDEVQSARSMHSLRHSFMMLLAASAYGHKQRAKADTVLLNRLTAVTECAC